MSFVGFVTEKCLRDGHICLPRPGHRPSVECLFHAMPWMAPQGVCCVLTGSLIRQPHACLPGHFVKRQN